MCAVMDRLEGGSVRQKWAEKGWVAENHAAYIVHGIVSAVRYCHDRYKELQL
jgi:hypothetical protein